MPRPKSPQTRALPKRPTLKIAPALKSAWTHHFAILTKAQSSGAKSFDALWESVDAIVNHTPPLYVVADFATANAFFAAVLKETPRTAQRNIRVARFATPEHERTYGVAALDAALGYLQAKNGAPLAGHHPIDFDHVKIPVTSKGATHMRSLRDVTVKDIAAATAKLTGPAHKAPKSDAFHAITKELSSTVPLADVGIHEHAGIFSFDHVPAAVLEHFGNAVVRGARKAPAKKTGKK